MEELKVKVPALCNALKEPMKMCRELSALFETECQNGDIGIEQMQKLCSCYNETITNAKTTLEKLALQMEVYKISMREMKGRYDNDDKADSGFVKSTDSGILDNEKLPVQETEQQNGKEAAEHDGGSYSSSEDENNSKC